MAYVLPALCYLRLEEGSLLDRAKLPALGVAIFGMVVAILGVVFLFMDLEKVNQCSHGQVMAYCTDRNSTTNTTLVSQI